MRKDTKILIIGPTPPPHHGVSAAIEALLRSSIREEFSLIHLDIADRRGIQHVDKPDLYDVLMFIRQWIALVWKLVRYRPNIVYVPVSQNTIGFLRDSFFTLPALLLRRRIIFHLHGGNFRDWLNGHGKFMQSYVRFLLRRLDKVIVLCESLANIFHGLVPEDRIAVVQNGIAWPTNESVSASPTTSTRRRIRFLYLGTVSRAKGIFCLLEAVERLREQAQRFDVVVAGPWLREDERRLAAQFLRDRDLTELIHFIGPINGDRKIATFHDADVFVFPGIQQEGQPLVVLEAMAAGLPILYTGRGCLADTVAQGENGIQVSVDESDGLSAAMRRLIDDSDARKQMGIASRHRFLKHYTLEAHVNQMREVFLDTLAEAKTQKRMTY